MHAEDRIIHFSAELIHRPMEHKKDVLRKLYFDLSQVRSAAYDSTDFTAPMQSRFYSRRGKKTQSVALFLPDRVVLIEEWADISVSEFIERVREVGDRTMTICGIDRFMAHTATIRSTFALSYYNDARAFLMDRACGQGGKIEPFFQRPIATAGLRFVLPETNEDPGILNVLIESFRHDTKEIFVEVKGIFAKHPVAPDEMDEIARNIRFVRSFITERIFPYVDQFDQPRDVFS